MDEKSGKVYSVYSLEVYIPSKCIICNFQHLIGLDILFFIYFVAKLFSSMRMTLVLRKILVIFPCITLRIVSNKGCRYE
jgi:hypothetical protein